MAGKNTMLEVGALTVPVKLEKVSARADVKLDRASPDGNKIKRVEIDAVTGATVDSDQVQQGVFENPTEGTGFRPIPKEALDAIEEETKLDSFEVNNFMPLKDVPWERVREAYYIAPQKGTSGKALKLLCEAMRKTKKAGIFKLVLTKRQYPAVLYVENGGLYVALLHFAADFKRQTQAALPLESVEVKSEQVALAVDLVNALDGDRSVLDSFEDDLIPLKQALVDKALAGHKVTARKKQKEKLTAADGLEDQLRKSVAGAQKRREKSKV